MKRIFFFLIFGLLMALPGMAQKASVELTISNVKNDAGFVSVGLEDAQGNKVDSVDLHAVAGKLHHVFNGLVDGDYAIRIMHDENSNNKLDTNTMGIPNEGYGFSNNPNSRFGPPDHAKLLFPVVGKTQATVEMKYYW